ncbi:MAG: hypothetical protein AB1801_17030 [Chloroflexota bacterium]
MGDLPIVQMTLYKHGVGYFRRRGPVSGQTIRLTFRREEMDDLLKSLTVLDHSGGTVQGMDYDTPQSREERLAGCSISLNDRRSLRDLLAALRGRQVQLLINDGSKIEGTLLGLDEDQEKPLEQSLAPVLRRESQTVAVVPLGRIEGVELADETAAADLRFFLQTALGQETHRSITIRLSPGEHDLDVSYIAPAPTWRVSYRLVVEGEPVSAALLQGWGIFDNRLEEDLQNISLSLIAGMPISFLYDLYTPHTPRRPVVKDEDRVAAAPIGFEGAEAAPVPKMAMRAASLRDAGMMRPAAAAPMAEALAASVESTAAGAALGELFQYQVKVPVSVGRGQSAMVPIVSSQLKPKKDLIYNGAKMAVHPVATLRFKNQTGLTLERGPVTVLENREYVGEAVLPFTADQAEAVIAYAVELGVHVKEESKTERQLHALSIKDGYLLQNLFDIRRISYRLDNRTPQPKTILIEHEVAANYIVFDTPEPAEKTLNTQRYQIMAAPGRITEWVVQERCLRAQHEELRSLTYRQLQQYFKDKLLDERTYDKLKEVLDLWANIERLEKRITEQEAERAKIYKSQEQIQKNMAALATGGEEGKLRGRYVQQLAASEDTLGQIEQTITRLRDEVKQEQAKIQQKIKNLA